VKKVKLNIKIISKKPPLSLIVQFKRSHSSSIYSLHRNFIDYLRHSCRKEDEIRRKFFFFLSDCKREKTAL